MGEFEKKDLLFRKLNELNSELEKYLIKPLKYLHGDEIQSILEYDSIHKIFYIVRTIKYYFGNVKFRMGVGIGELDEKSKVIIHTAEYSQELDETCFHAARKAFESLNKKNNLLSGYNTYFVIAGKNNIDIINDFTRLIDVTTDQWKNHHFEVVRYVEDSKNMTHEEVAKIIGKEKSQVSKYL